jgi:hypothetical protein
VVRSPVIWSYIGLSLWRYRRSNLWKISKTVTVCMSAGSMCSIDAVFSHWCRPTFRSVCTVWYATIAVKINVDSCSMSTTPHAKHGVPVRFAHKSEKYAKSKNTSKIRNLVIYGRISMRFEVFESTRRAALDGQDVSVIGGETIISCSKSSISVVSHRISTKPGAFEVFRCRSYSRSITSYIRWKSSSVDCNKPHVNRSRTDRVIEEIRMLHWWPIHMAYK